MTPQIDRLLLGDNPLIGVDHLSQERARERLERLNTGRIVEVIETATANGAQGFLFSTHPTIYAALKAIRQAEAQTPLNLYPLLPYAQAYVRTATEKGVLGLVQDVLGKLSWRGRMKALAAGLSMATADPATVLNAYVDAELDILTSNAPEGSVLKSVIMHEVITDVATSFKAGDILQSYAAHVIDEYKVKPGFATRNFPRFVRFADQIGLEFSDIVILTPFNKVGFQMNPSREACEETLKRDRMADANIIAMSILASGYLKLPEATQYLSKLNQLKSIVVGTSSREHAKKTFTYLSRNPPFSAAKNPSA